MDDRTINPEFAFDPMDTSRTKDWELMGRIRQAGPVIRPAEGIVFTSRYGETAKTFRDARNFSSVGDMRAPGVVVPIEESFLGEMDPPLHPKIRRILRKGFTPAAAAADEPWARVNVSRRLDALVAAGGGDLMKTVAIPLPGSIAAHALGVPDELHDQVMDWCNELLHSSWPATGRTELGEGIEQCFPDFAACLDGLIREREEAGPDAPADLLSTMVFSADSDGWRIPTQMVRTQSVNILAGSLSASYMLGNLMYRFIVDEDGFTNVLRSDRSKVPPAVEESLRLEAPVTFLTRTAKHDGAIGGCPVDAGEHVVLGIASGNQDERVYPDAGEFRLDRDGSPEHLAFGAGPHLCLGNHLTRMVGKVVLDEMLDRFAPGRLVLAEGYRWVCVDHIQEYGPETLDVVIQAC
ncbi:MAG TPA: cytochrome P450 [Acidimicrobiales bacterium]|jgi:cytochrome P450